MGYKAGCNRPLFKLSTASFNVSSSKVYTVGYRVKKALDVIVAETNVSLFIF